jgi:kynurenine formamidase
MSVPRKLTIAGHTIKITHKKGLVVGSTEAWGAYEDSSHTIYLRTGMDKTRKAEILLHECIHAIDHIHVLGLSEKAVKILGIEILALLKNNKIKL